MEHSFGGIFYFGETLSFFETMVGDGELWSKGDGKREREGFGWRWLWKGDKKIRVRRVGLGGLLYMVHWQGILDRGQGRE